MPMASADHIFFNRPYITGKEAANAEQVFASRKLSGDGPFTAYCQDFFQRKYGFGKVLLTPSCTAALEMSALLLNIGPGDEVIMPSYTFVSTANAFALRGAKIVFADSCADHPNIDPQQVQQLVSPKTKAIAVVHYAGMGCEMEKLTAIARESGAHLVEDAAHAINARYKGQVLGTFGAVSTMSFHETKNITCGEGGFIAINAPSLQARAEIISAKGTNRKAFYRKETNHYSWVDVGSSYQPSEVSAAVLAAQINELDAVQQKRLQLWERYDANLKSLEHEGKVKLPVVPDGSGTNGHIYYIVCHSVEERAELIGFLAAAGIDAVFHYISLHSSPYFAKQHDGRALPNSDKFTQCLLRLPMYFDLSLNDVDRVCENISEFYRR